MTQTSLMLFGFHSVDILVMTSGIVVVEEFAEETHNGLGILRSSLVQLDLLLLYAVHNHMLTGIPSIQYIPRGTRGAAQEQLCRF